MTARPPKETVTLASFAELATAMGLPRKPSFEEARAERLAEEQRVEALCAQNLEREERLADIAHSRSGTLNSFWHAADLGLTPVNRAAARDAGMAPAQRPAPKRHG